MSGVGDGLRMSFGTLTIVPTRPPGRVDREVAGWAMTFAPLAAGMLAVPVAATVWLLDDDLSPLLLSALAVAALALLTRAIHLDGLADTADGLGSGRPAEAALDIMRRGDVGPFGVVTVVLTLMVQVSALAALVTAGHGVVAIVAALVASRLTIPLVCFLDVPAARPDGLGAAVARSVSRPQLMLAFAFTVVLLTAAAFVDESRAGPDLFEPTVVLVSVGIGMAGTGVAWWSQRRLGGLTGDVLGACVEVAFAAVLVGLCFV